MTTELSSKYDPSSVESQAYAVWLAEKCFHADPARPGEPYTIVIPPPNVTGALHLGHAINNTLQDILIRMHRMRGCNTLWIPGIDHAGIATQAVVEKQLKEKENKTRHDVGREALIERIWAWKELYGNRIIEQLQRLGCSCDWDRTRFTLDDMCAKAVRETFLKLFKDGLIYRGKRLVNWDTFLQTSISDDEIYHETVKTSLWHIRYPIVDGDKNFAAETAKSAEKNTIERAANPKDAPESNQVSALSAISAANPSSATDMTVATTRPETMLGDTAVAVHSEDPRWNWAIGKFVKLPLTGRLIPIIADDILVDPKFGTGVVKVTPAHDPNDYAVWQRHKGQPDEIDLINILTPDGRIVDDARWQKYANMKRDTARKQVVEDLKAEGLLEKEEPYETQVGHSDRSKTPIEPYLSDQWFVKMAPLAEPALQVVREGIIKFFPERYAQTYLAWLGEKRDWPISRQLWWGHRIPVWRRSQRLEQPLPPIELAQVMTKLNQWCASGQLAYQLLSDVEGISPLEAADPNLALLYICLREDTHDPEILAFFQKYGLEQDPDVLDTWFSSALWPHSTLGWPEQTPELKKYYPTSVLLTGRDIITLWVARMVMTGMYNMGRSQKPEARSQEEETRRQEPGDRSQEGEAGSWKPEAGSQKSDGISPSPLYSGERDGVRGPSAQADDSRNSKGVPSPQPSPLSTGERERGRRLGIPFFHVAINPTILDGKGERMSKSKGNGVDPVDIIFSHGADALRLTLTNMATETQDARMPVQVVCPHCAERIPNPEGKEPGMNCPKCKKSLTRPVATATGSPDAPLARMTSDKFDLGRNFCNKLWNACRFALSNLEEISKSSTVPRETDGAGSFRPDSERSSEGSRDNGPAVRAGRHDPTPSFAQGEPVDESKWSLADRWIVSRFNRTVDEVNKALETYRFDVYAKSCYDFFWGDFCDWYVEAIKPALRDPARRGQTAHVLASVIDGCLRLMHPMIPFITETVWWRLNDVRPQRGLPGRIDCPPSKRLVLAKWPTVGDFSQASEHIFPKLQALIVAIRNIRNEHQVNPKQTVAVSLKAASEPTRQIIANREMIELLATCTIKQVREDLPPIANAATASVDGCEIFVEGLVNADAEKQRLTKAIEETTKKRDNLTARLRNEAYTAKAPPKLVEQTKEQLAAAEAELVKLTDALRKLG